MSALPRALGGQEDGGMERGKQMSGSKDSYHGNSETWGGGRAEREREIGMEWKIQ